LPVADGGQPRVESGVAAARSEVRKEALRSLPCGRSRRSPGDLLVLGTPVRSGQSVFSDGNVTVGRLRRRIVAGGSIHVYGTLRWCAVGAFSANQQARIFCSKIGRRRDSPAVASTVAARPPLRRGACPFDEHCVLQGAGPESGAPGRPTIRTEPHNRDARDIK
jgi:Septum formation inhibitor MinC, C-terminal domain